MSSLATVLLFILLLLTTTTAAAVSKTPTLPEWLEEYIFPDILHVKSYTLNKESGEFKINLRATIDISSTSESDGFHLKCKSTIRGVMSKDMSSVTKLEGVSAKVGVSWADIQEITRIGFIAFSFTLVSVVVVILLPFSIVSHSPSCSVVGGFCTKVLGFVKEKMKKHWSL
ncbi:hypothetical protein L1987_76476 [Smallanthus sonchifolius]|uniref:Uncharacterized protein n=1 Tax=Smallanthus sonchifolius TaxID=185202 RepID=A0ACB8Z6B1_9ASTR|nr:hypothetical protein L1987_76476 [Smallanthus sonchifolius]